jgi:hypothetical protein
MPMLDAYIPDGALTPQAERKLLATRTESGVVSRRAHCSRLPRPSRQHWPDGAGGRFRPPVAGNAHRPPARTWRTPDHE